jgi:hypothetical protein
MIPTSFNGEASGLPPAAHGQTSALRLPCHPSGYFESMLLASGIYISGGLIGLVLLIVIIVLILR